MFERIPEPELMDDHHQVAAYSAANFNEAHQNLINTLKSKLPQNFKPKTILDLGCGPGDMTFRLHNNWVEAQITAVDGGENMIEASRRYFAQLLMGGGAPIPVRWICAMLSDVSSSLHVSFDLIFSNSLLHHLAKPAELWSTVKRLSVNGSFIFVSDLMRPTSITEAKSLTEKYSANEPDILKTDFYNSLLAAYRVEEVEQQLIDAGLPLTVEQVTDRHIVVYGSNPL